MKTLGAPIILGLPDLCADIISYCLQLKRRQDPGDVEALRLQFDELFRTLEARARQADISEQDVTGAKYALVAYIDEMILGSEWQAVKEVWSGNPLQMSYFNDFAAGEEFFNKLEEYRKNLDNPKKVDVLEVYYTCMALGFKGMHADLQGIEKLKTLMEGIGKDIRRARAKAEEIPLSTNWKPPDGGGGATKGVGITKSVWSAVILGVLLLGVFIVLALILNGIADKTKHAIG